MGIYILPEPKYKCSKCGSENCHKYTKPAKSRYSGHYEGIKCDDCGHFSEWYKESVFERESGHIYSWSYDPNKPQEF